MEERLQGDGSTWAVSESSLLCEAIERVSHAQSKVDLGVRTLRAIEEIFAVLEDLDFLCSFAPARPPTRRGCLVVLVGVLDGTTLEICSSIPPHRAALTLDVVDENSVRAALVEAYRLTGSRRHGPEPVVPRSADLPDAGLATDFATYPLVVDGELEGMVLVVHPDLARRDSTRWLETLATVSSTVLGRLDAVEQVEELEAAKSELANCLVRTSEEERALLAGDIHDGPLQGMAAAAYYLQMAREESAERAEEDSAGMIERAEQILREEMRKLRIIMTNLLPPPVDPETDFVSCVSRGIDRVLEEFPDAPIELDAPDGALELPAEMASLLFRCIQEALRNAAKHSRASRIRVALEKRGDCLVVVVEDDGVGFEVEKTRDAAARGHIGLAYMKKRVEILGGALLVSSSPGRGTRIEVAVFIPST